MFGALVPVCVVLDAVTVPSNALAIAFTSTSRNILIEVDAVISPSSFTVVSAVPDPTGVISVVPLDLNCCKLVGSPGVLFTRVNALVFDV